MFNNQQIQVSDIALLDIIKAYKNGQEYETRMTNVLDFIRNNKTLNQQVKNADFNVEIGVDEYYIDLSSNSVTAIFNILEYGKRNVTFIILGGSVYDFIIDEVTGSPGIIGNPVPYNTQMKSYDSITVTNDGSNFYIK